MRRTTFFAATFIFLVTWPMSTVPEPQADPSAASLDPAVTIEGGSDWQREMLDDALGRFKAAGLALPDLDVLFSQDRADCHGGLGYFHPKYRPWRITICNDKTTTVYLHELAHAWTRSNLDDGVRAEFAELRGLPTWNDHDFDWNERAFEQAANVIARGLADQGKFSWMSSDLDGFELLTGIEAPRNS